MDAEPYTALAVGCDFVMRHETTFEMTERGRRVREHHVQRPYAQETVRTLLRSLPLDVVAAYDGRTTTSADDESRRIHWVLRRAVAEPGEAT